MYRFCLAAGRVFCCDPKIISTNPASLNRFGHPPNIFAGDSDHGSHPARGARCNGVAMVLFLYFGLKPTTLMTDLGLTGAKFAKFYRALEVAKTRHSASLKPGMRDLVEVAAEFGWQDCWIKKVHPRPKGAGKGSSVPC